MSNKFKFWPNYVLKKWLCHQDGFTNFLLTHHKNSTNGTMALHAGSIDDLLAHHNNIIDYRFQDCSL